MGKKNNTNGLVAPQQSIYIYGQKASIRFPTCVKLYG